MTKNSEEASLVMTEDVIEEVKRVGVQKTMPSCSRGHA